MVSTELQVVEATVVDLPVPLSEGKARVLDKRIRQASIRVADESANLLDLLEEAAVGQAHIALGFASWTAYVKDAVSITPTDDNERKALVSLMSGKGMSQRAIADVVGVNQATVSRDLAEGDAPVSGKTTGLDNKEYERTPKQKPLDVEEVEEPEPKPQPISQDFKDEMGYLFNSVSAFNDILADERFPKARNTIARNNLDKLTEYIADLQKIADELTE